MADQSVSPFNPVTGEPRTIHTETKTIGDSSQRNELSPEAIKALAQQRRSEADQLDAMAGSGPIAAQPTPEALDADLASQEQSARVVAKDPNAAVVAPPEQDVSWGASPQPAIPETPRFTSQQFNQSIDSTRPTTAAAQKDENAADMAAAQQRLAQEEIRQREELAKQIAAAQAQWQSEMDKASTDYAKIASLSTRQVTPLMRLAAGLGALGASNARTPNFAGDAIQREMDRSLEEKKALMHAGLQKLEALRAGPAQLEKFRERALADILAKQKAEVELMKSAADRMMARFPQASDALAAEKAKLQAGFDKEYAQYIGTRTARQFSKEAPRVTDTSALGAGSERPTPANDVQNFAIMKEHGQMAARIKELIAQGHVPTPEMEREYEQNENLLLNRIAKEEEHGKPSVLWSNFLRTAGVQPENSYPEGADRFQREYLDLRRGLKHFTAFKFGGQTGAANAGSRHTFAGPRWGEAGEPVEDATRKDLESANAIEDAWTMAKDISRAGEKEQKVEARKEKAGKHATGASDTASDYAAILANKSKLSDRDKREVAEAALSQKKAAAQGKTDEDAERFFREFRQRKGF